MIVRVLLTATLLMAGCRIALAGTDDLNGTYVATAYAQKGTTASGQIVHPHVVAADPDVLPIGSRIKIKRAGRYSGEYVVADTGDKIQGRRLDIYLPSTRACKKFGSKPVRVKVVQLGDNTHEGAKQADKAVKEDVKQDVQKQVVGNAATEADWAKAHPGAAKAAATSTATTKQSTTTTVKSTTTNPDH